ncbi:hypothetical protein T08_14789 [Trichinella sp. T8]|nr:hypothetical protein T08_14789 [Trichinella sp. T8]
MIACVACLASLYCRYRHHHSDDHPLTELLKMCKKNRKNSIINVFTAAERMQTINIIVQQGANVFQFFLPQALKKILKL